MKHDMDKDIKTLRKELLEAMRKFDNKHPDLTFPVILG